METPLKTCGWFCGSMMAAVAGLAVIAGAAKQEPQALAKAESKQADWFQYRGPHRNGISDESGWKAEFPGDGPKILWKARVGTGFATVSISDGRLYTAGNDGKNDIISCLDAETGKEIWKKSYPCDIHAIQHEGGPSATPSVDGDRVYMFSKQGQLHCFKAENGDVIWSLDVKKEFGAIVPRWGYSGSPLVKDEKLIVDAGKTYALDKMTGKVIWSSAEDLGAGYSSPVSLTADGKPGFAIFNAYGLVILTEDAGKELDRYEWDTNYDVNAATPLVNGDEVFISSGYNKGCALLAVKEGKLKELWKNRGMRNHFNSSVLWKGHLYGFDDTEVKCLDYKTGDEKWSQRGLGKGSLMLADGKLICLSDKGELVIAEAKPEKFEEISRGQVLGGKCWTVPVLSHGRIYCRNAAGDLVCVDVRAK